MLVKVHFTLLLLYRAAPFGASLLCHLVFISPTKCLGDFCLIEQNKRSVPSLFGLICATHLPQQQNGNPFQLSAPYCVMCLVHNTLPQKADKFKHYCLTSIESGVQPPSRNHVSAEDERNFPLPRKLHKHIL